MSKPKLSAKDKLALTLIISAIGLAFIGCIILLSAIIVSLFILSLSILCAFGLLMAFFIYIASIVFKDYITEFNEEKNELSEIR